MNAQQCKISLEDLYNNPKVLSTSGFIKYAENEGFSIQEIKEFLAKYKKVAN